MSLKTGIESIPRAPGITDRLTVVGLGGRLMDELLSGLPAVLMPTIRAQLGLSYSQIGLLGLALNTIAAVIEPINGLLIDLWKRPWLMAWGATGIGLGTMLVGVAPTFALLLMGFAVYGLASGPLAHTADVVLVEAYPQAPDRIFARATLLDTLGALLAPLLVSATIWLGLAWRWLLVSLGLSSLLYAVLILRTSFPKSVDGRRDDGQSFRGAIRENLRVVLRSRAAKGWLLFLLVHAVLETPLVLNTVWLREQVGMSQALIGVYKVAELAVSIVSLIVLERWLAHSSHRGILRLATLAVLLIYPAWLHLPGIWTRFALMVPLQFVLAVYWPIGMAQALASVPGRGGTVTALHSIFGLVPLPLLFGLLAEAVTLTRAMLLVTVAAALLILLVVQLIPDKMVRVEGQSALAGRNLDS